MSTIKFQQLPSYTKLQNIQSTMQDKFKLKDAFTHDTNRFNKFHISTQEITLDYSKQLINQESMQLLLELAQERNLQDDIKSLLSGAKLNQSENRAALHTGIRRPYHQALMLDGVDIMVQVKSVHEKIQTISDKIRNLQWYGSTNKQITDVVNIGIGGSFLGPKMAFNALSAFVNAPVTCHFLANIDGSEFYQLVKKLNPETTLFIIASKSFNTLETLKNTELATKWLQSANLDLSKHFIAVSNNVKAAKELNIADSNILPMWDFVGGRFSMWSAIGLIIAIAIGFDKFIEMLQGANAMDEHFATAPLDRNMPVITGLLAVWYQNFWGVQSHAVLPYDHYLRFLPAYLQQLDMESCGKSTLQTGASVDCNTGCVIWGDEGCNGQHSYHQLLHQGTLLIPCDFIAVLKSQHNIEDTADWMFANCLAQSLALAFGTEKGADQMQAEVNLADAKFMPGNRPSSTIVLKELTPRTLGALIALYEHKVFVQSRIWGINAFDQWGVELGKKIANEVYATIHGDGRSYDSSTNALINLYCQQNNSVHK